MAHAKNPAGAKRGRRLNKPIDLYYWPTPNGWKISIMLEESGLPYNVIPVNIARGDQFKPAFLNISPNNRMPAIVDPDGPGGRPISVFESAPSCNTSAAKPENSPRPASALVWRWTSGCSGRWPISSPRPVKLITSAAMRRNGCRTRLIASATR
jgi:hypothetical protein